MLETNSNLSDAALERARRARDFEPDPTPDEIEAQGLERYEVPGPHGIPYVFWREREAICPACEAGDHEHAAICEADYKCGCACHTPRKLPRGMGRRLDDYELLGYDLATGRAA